jgi:hypothetical protein
MTEAERARLTDEWVAAHAHEWDAWNGRSPAEQAADLDKINAAGDAGGPVAARQMMRALGLPTLPDELCDPVEALEARRAEGDQWMREQAGQVGMSPADIDLMLQPSARVVH